MHGTDHRSGNKRDNVTVIYTPWSNLKKDGSMAVGQVGFHNQKMVSFNRVRSSKSVLCHSVHVRHVSHHAPWRLLPSTISSFRIHNDANATVKPLSQTHSPSSLLCPFKPWVLFLYYLFPLYYLTSNSRLSSNPLTRNAGSPHPPPHSPQPDLKPPEQNPHRDSTP